MPAIQPADASPAPRSRRPRAWLVALGLASFLAPCHAPVADAAAGATGLICAITGWVGS